MRINFYLKKPEDKKGNLDIYMQATYAGKKYAFYFGQKVKAEFWNKSTQRVIINKSTIDNNLVRINDIIDAIEKATLENYNALVSLENPVPQWDKIKKQLQMIITGKEQKHVKKVNKSKEEQMVLIPISLEEFSNLITEAVNKAFRK